VSYSSDLRIDRVTHADLVRVAELHRRAFPDAAITSFGLEAVRRYYLWLIEGPHDAAVMGAFRHDTLLGFCAAGVFRGAMNGFLRENRAFLAHHLLLHPRLLASSLIRDRLREALRITARYSRRLRSTRSSSGSATDVPRFGVLSIATDPDVRGSGAGRALMLEAETRAREQHHDKMILTVHPENERAVRFYEQLGWVRSLDNQVWRGAMVKHLTEQTP
jgi:ribosomal protein S18 acetylase RimI-like enzyme